MTTGNVGIGNGLGAAMHTRRSLDELEAEAASFGYTLVEVGRIEGTRDYRAVATNGKDQRVEALGRNEVGAVASLVRVLKF